MCDSVAEDKIRELEEDIIEKYAIIDMYKNRIKTLEKSLEDTLNELKFFNEIINSDCISLKLKELNKSLGKALNFEIDRNLKASQHQTNLYEGVIKENSELRVKIKNLEHIIKQKDTDRIKELEEKNERLIRLNQKLILGTLSQ